METQARIAAQELMEFIAAAPSPFHAVAKAAERLSRAGFQRLSESDTWRLEPHGRYFVTRDGSALAALISGGGPSEEVGLRIIGTHTDSPTFRLKPLPAFERQGYIQLGLESYGGPILATWLDRDLGLAGRVYLSESGRKPRTAGKSARGKSAGSGAGSKRTGEETAGNGLESRLLKIDRPVARIAHLAIHLDRESAEKGLLLNRENHLPPILGLSGEGAWDFHAWLGAELGVAPERILDHDLVLFDLTPPALAGIAEEFLVASRLDNLSSTHAALMALLRGAKQETEATRVIMLCDSEEIGSGTRQGASGTFLGDVIERIAVASHVSRRRGSRAQVGWDPQVLHRVRSKSYFVSADLAHAIHPNYPEKHEARHAPKLNGGPVIKYSASQRYSTDGESGAFFLKICREAEVPSQKYVVRADMTAGSTIGPLVSSKLGLKAVDIGSAVLSMHSCRETGGSLDPDYMVRAMARFLTR